ncbi:uncharacterized protein LOC141612987 [Silene latifolia]|uniref:uncharacterized protein LOC141612987 n=1 Tax=Silene latifolia TaxID=37657 RepID=UPI003D76A85E
MSTKFDIEKIDGKISFAIWRVQMRVVLIQNGLKKALDDSTDWSSLALAFYRRYFPPQRTNALKGQITAFEQLPTEDLNGALCLATLAEKVNIVIIRIPETICTIPANASHRVGIGAIVLTEKRELLVVQENSGRLRGTGIWKVPTGVVDEGADICVAAVREVKEETGVSAFSVLVEIDTSSKFELHRGCA